MTESRQILTIEWIEIEKLNPAVYNPRKDLKPDDPEYIKIQKSIHEFGLVEPLVVNKDMTVIGGHQRLKILQEAGFKTVPCSVVDIKKEKEPILNIALNNPPGKWDYPKLKELIVEIDSGDFDIELTGFDESELKEIFDYEKIEKDDDVNEKDDDIPTLDAGKTITKKGDLWLLGKHRLLCGDATSKEDFEKLMDDKKADMVFTDPPYGVDYTSKNSLLNSFNKGTRIQTPIGNDTLSPNEISVMWKKSFSLMCDFMTPGASYYMTAPQGAHLLFYYFSALEESGLGLRHTLIWVKNNHVLGRCDYHYKHEPILYGWKKGSHKFYGGNSQFSVWEINKPLKSDLHPTMKPIELIERAIKNSSLPQNIILDPYLGSGSTLITCEKTTRICYGIEIAPHYCDIIIKRWEEYTNKKAELMETTYER